MKKLALEKNKKRRIDGDDDDHDDHADDVKLNPEKKLAQCDLLSILPKPQHSTFGPTIKLDKILKMPEILPTTKSERISDTSEVLEVDVSKLVSEDRLIEKTVVEKPTGKISVAPKEKQKNQITYLAQLGKATELERKDQAAQSRFNKSAARAKYGW